MGGAHVFPGGRLDEGDRLPEPAAWCEGLPEAAVQMGDLPHRDAADHLVGAIRELFEEAGVLLARPCGPRVSVGSQAQQRAALIEGTTTIGALAAALDVRLRCDALVYAANWCTPESEPKRYDVRFFFAVAPDDQTVTPDDHELTDSVWIDPADAVDRCRRRDILLAPPTWTTLRILSRFACVEDALAWARATQKPRVQPMLFEHDGERMLALPGDERYPAIPGLEPFCETRFRFIDRRWVAIE